jgi:hypothetical protein
MRQPDFVGFVVFVVVVVELVFLVVVVVELVVEDRSSGTDGIVRGTTAKETLVSRSGSHGFVHD